LLGTENDGNNLWKRQGDARDDDYDRSTSTLSAFEVIYSQRAIQIAYFFNYKRFFLSSINGSI